jgi:predicted phosphodiesterase
MKIITYSDLHLEFGGNWELPEDVEGDLMILAGDIISLKNYVLLEHFLKDWKKPVLYVTGNHEYYTQRPMNEEEYNFKVWLKVTLPQVRLLLDEPVNIDGVQFFGGTMWTDFNGADPNAIEIARYQMNDFRLIRNPDNTVFQPENAIERHNVFVTKLRAWLGQDLKGPRVVISHNAPVINPNTQYVGSPLMPAFNSLDMVKLIEEYQPDLWVYGHTHECDDQTLGKTRIISNQLGYPQKYAFGGFECPDFDPYGKLSAIS